MNEQLILEALTNWTKLNEVINQLSEAELKAALNIERKHQCRKNFLIRIHRKYCTVRGVRERAELLEACA